MIISGRNILYIVYLLDEIYQSTYFYNLRGWWGWVLLQRFMNINVYEDIYRQNTIDKILIQLHDKSIPWAMTITDLWHDIEDQSDLIGVNLSLINADIYIYCMRIENCRMSTIERHCFSFQRELNRFYEINQHKKSWNIQFVKVRTATWIPIIGKKEGKSTS